MHMETGGSSATPPIEQAPKTAQGQLNSIAERIQSEFQNKPGSTSLPDYEFADFASLLMSEKSLTPEDVNVLVKELLALRAMSIALARRDTGAQQAQYPLAQVAASLKTLTALITKG